MAVLVTVCGPMGAGKTTLARRIQHNFTCDVLTTAKLLEANKQLAVHTKTVGDYIESGELVPDSVVNKIIENTVETYSSEANVIIEGFPRTLAQADSLVQNRHLSQIIFLDVPVAVSRERVRKRKVCLECKSTYHPEFYPPTTPNTCDSCGAQLAESEPFLDHIEASFERMQDLKSQYQDCEFFVTVDAARPPDCVWHAVADMLTEIL